MNSPDVNRCVQLEKRFESIKRQGDWKFLLVFLDMHQQELKADWDLPSLVNQINEIMKASNNLDKLIKRL